MFFYTYVLFSFKDKKLYIGYTNNLKRRLKEHSQGKNVRGSAHGIQYLN
ncbi:hypothetical protein COV24_00725, partial [candidate division WWE3 bacterium CG10_big_fil_rev_8_21_14_0_10_32_10]